MNYNIEQIKADFNISEDRFLGIDQKLEDEQEREDEIKHAIQNIESELDNEEIDVKAIKTYLGDLRYSLQELVGSHGRTTEMLAAALVNLLGSDGSDALEIASALDKRQIEAVHRKRKLALLIE